MYKCLSARTGPVIRSGASFLCAKFVDVDMVIIHAKFQSSKPFWLKHKDFKLAS